MMIQAEQSNYQDYRYFYQVFYHYQQHQHCHHVMSFSLFRLILRLLLPPPPPSAARPPLSWLLGSLPSLPPLCSSHLPPLPPAPDPLSPSLLGSLQRLPLPLFLRHDCNGNSKTQCQTLALDNSLFVS